MRNMSFALTTMQVSAQKKTVTRRFGWWFLKPGDLVQPVRKAMGLKKGEAIEKIGPPIRIVSTRREPLCAITREDVMREGFPPEWSPQDFVDMIRSHYGNVTSLTPVNRIEFEYTKRNRTP